MQSARACLAPKSTLSPHDRNTVTEKGTPAKGGTFFFSRGEGWVCRTTYVIYCACFYCAGKNSSSEDANMTRDARGYPRHEREGGREGGCTGRSHT